MVSYNVLQIHVSKDNETEHLIGLTWSIDGQDIPEHDIQTE